MDQLKKEFKGLLEKSGWSQAEAARQLGMTPSALSQIVRANSPVKPSPVTLRLFKLLLEHSSPEKAGKILQRNQSGGVNKSKRVLLQPARKGEMYLSEEQPGGERSDNPKLEEAIKRLIHMSHSDPERAEKYIRDIEWDHERILSQSKTKKTH